MTSLIWVRWTLLPCVQRAVTGLLNSWDVCERWDKTEERKNSDREGERERLQYITCWLIESTAQPRHKTCLFSVTSAVCIVQSQAVTWRNDGMQLYTATGEGYRRQWQVNWEGRQSVLKALMVGSCSKNIMGTRQQCTAVQSCRSLKEGMSQDNSIIRMFGKVISSGISCTHSICSIMIYGFPTFSNNLLTRFSTPH